jgi:hypothetical protein
MNALWRKTEKMMSINDWDIISERNGKTYEETEGMEKNEASEDSKNEKGLFLDVPHGVKKKD